MKALYIKDGNSHQVKLITDVIIKVTDNGLVGVYIETEKGKEILNPRFYKGTELRICDVIE